MFAALFDLQIPSLEMDTFESSKTCFIVMFVKWIQILSINLLVLNISKLMAAYLPDGA